MFPHFKVTKIVCLAILVFNSSTFFAQSTTSKKELKKSKPLEKAPSDATDLAPDRKNYKINLKTVHQPSHDFVNEQEVHYELNRKNISLQTGYDFIFDPFSPEGYLKRDRPNQDIGEWDLNKRTIYRNHRALLDMEIRLNGQNKLLLHQQFNYTHTDKKDHTLGREIKKNMQRNHLVKSYHFSQVWQHLLSKATTIEVGGMENFVSMKNPGQSITATQIQSQQLKTKTTAMGGFASLQHQHTGGTTKATFEYQGLSLEENGQQGMEKSAFFPAFQYRENLFSFRLAHRAALSQRSALDFELGIENPHLRKNATHVKEEKLVSHQKEKHLDVTYQLSYSSTPTKNQSYTLSIEKRLIRPTYDQLNPITTLYYDLIYTSGTLNLHPTKEYTLSLETTQKQWTLQLYAGYAKDLIVRYYTLEDQRLLLTNANFNTPFLAGLNTRYTRDFFSGFWSSHTHGQLVYRRIEAEKALRNTPRLKVYSAHTFHLGHSWKTGLNFTYASNYKDPFTKHFHYTQLDVFIEKKIGKNLKISIFGEDIFKANRKWEQFRVEDALFSRNINLDHNTYGIALQYRIKGKEFQHRHIAKPKDPLLQRIP